jgi:hypothetical protein
VTFHKAPGVRTQDVEDFRDKLELVVKRHCMYGVFMAAETYSNVADRSHIKLLKPLTLEQVARLHARVCLEAPLVRHVCCTRVQTRDLQTFERSALVDTRAATRVA